MSNQGSSALHICIMAKEDIMQNKDSKFAAGMQVTCPYLFCNFKNSQFQSAGRFPSGLNDFLTIDWQKFVEFLPIHIFRLHIVTSFKPATLLFPESLVNKHTKIHPFSGLAKGGLISEGILTLFPLPKQVAKSLPQHRLIFTTFWDIPSCLIINCHLRKHLNAVNT